MRKGLTWGSPHVGRVVIVVDICRTVNKGEEQLCVCKIMSGTTNELPKMAASNEEDIISEMLSLQKIEDQNDVSVCANCGKEGSNLNICNKCKEATYCNAACKKKHRKQHKKKCEKRVAELHDEALFKEPPPEHGDCPICFLLLPSMASGQRYMSCCGKTICSGCSYADVYDNLGNIIAGEKCPFCRASDPISEKEVIERLKKRMDVGDTYAFHMMGTFNFYGLNGLPQDRAKATKFWRKAGKFGLNNIGNSYYNGDGVERDKKMARYYDELAAMDGVVSARHNLGICEYNAGNYDKALKHFMISMRGGCTRSIEKIQQMYMDGHATKDHYANALRSHQAYIIEIKSDQRDKAAAFSNDYRYY